MEKKNVWKEYDEKKLNETEKYAKDYCDFLNHGKTERECCDEIVNRIEKEGYIELQDLINHNKKLKMGDKVYSVCMNKSVIMFQIGESPLTDGLNILGAHIDSPRIDLKQCPLYEDSELALFKTHYYGGVKKYQWTTIPLSIHGVMIKSNGEKMPCTESIMCSMQLR